MLNDLRFAFRLLLKNRGFAAVTLLTLALCIGANTAIFSAVYALMLKPLPFPQPDRIVEIYNTYAKAGLPKAASNVVDYLDYKEHTTAFSDFGLWASNQSMFGEDATSNRLWAARATAEFFNVLGLKPLIGQFFTLENSRPNEDKVVVLTQSFWVAQFHEDPGVLGKTVRIDGDTCTIIGVVPRALESFDARIRFIRPYAWDPARVNPQSRHANYVQLFARLKPAATLGQALAEGETLERRFYDGAPPPLRTFIDRSGARIQMGSVQAERVQPLKSTLLMLQGGVILVLLIGCVNIANLLLARANGRQSELAVRFALGATRGLISRQLLIETLLLTTLGTALGLGIAWSAVAAMNHYRADMMAEALPFTLDGRVLAFTVGVSVLAALLISFVPIIHVVRANLMELIHRSSRGSSGSAGVRALSSILIVGQVAVALMLLAGAGLLIHSFIRAIAVDPGFDPRGVITGRIAIPQPLRATDDAARTLQDRVQQAMKEIPGVESVALSFAVPFQGGLPINALTLFEDTLPPGSPQPGAYRVFVTPDYLAALRLRLVEGRFFERADTAPGQRGMVVDETFAKRFFPGRSALGGRFVFGGRPDKDSDWPTIIGVVRNVPHNGVEDHSGNPFVYQLVAGRPGGLTLFLRTSRPATDMIALMREKLRVIDPSIALFDTGSLQTFIDSSYNQRRAVMLLLGCFALLALFLSAIGIYGVLAYDVSQRTREIGVRGAIGASYYEIVGLILRQGLWKTGIGLVLGLVGALLLSRTMKSLLFDLSATDPWAYVAVSIVLLLVAALASYLPARRAAKINPIEALRVE
jgi:putative ABC transport system permease protein